MNKAPAIRTKDIGAKDMAQQLGALVVFPGNLSTLPITHDGQLTIACNYRCRESNVLS